jgi:nitroimidazol reductase NimA-like FMN-containing flavoprotein (pyridoxamine 5'-phosphate oxidase superfamily)
MTLVGPTPRTTHKRLPQRGSHDREVIHSILDEGLVCHIGFVAEGQPFVIPTIYARVGERLYVHGAGASRMLTTLKEGAAVCVEVTLVDALVLARSAFHHSMNYRSVMIFGVAQEAVDPSEKRQALEAIVEHVVPGRMRETRPPSAAEIAGTRVLWIPILEASAKVRTGPPVDSEDDHALAHWAGELPLRMIAGTPVADPRLAEGIAVPPSVGGYRRPRDTR